MKKLLILSALLVNTAYADLANDALMATGKSNLELDKAISVKKQLTLDDAFAVQAYGQLRALGIRQEKINSFYDDVFAGNFDEALKGFPKLTNDKRVNDLLIATKLYLYWNKNLSQNFVSLWVEEASRYPFLDSQLGVALDQIISPDASNWLLKNAVILSSEDKVKIDSIAKYESKFNYSIQAYRNLRRGEKSLTWIKYLPKLDPLRIKLSESVILQFAREGRLADAAKVLKEVVEPALENTTNIEKLADHHLILARLLYQAGAYNESLEYYSYIPDESRRFLNAQVESLWILMRQGNLARIKGKLASLELDVLEDKFNPEVYLVSSMASLKLCQFIDVEMAFKRFVSTNKKFIKEIEENLASSNPKVSDAKDFYIRKLVKAKMLRMKELDQLVKISATALNKEVFTRDLESIQAYQSEIANLRTIEIKRGWENRKKVLDATIKRLRFVKVEYLSKMRRLRNQLAMNKQNSDSVKTISSGIDKSDKLEFPHEGILFSDELFNLDAEVMKLCAQGK